MDYTNSPLVSLTKLSTMHSGQRQFPISRITPHIYVGQVSIRDMGNLTAESTAFQVVTIDPESKTVYAHHWGAGIDMILHYDPTEETSFSTDLTSPTWASNDEEIATVSGGAVTPVTEGYVIIWAKSEADNCIECWNFHSSV